MIQLLKNIKGDKVIWVVVLILCIFSLLAVYSATGTLSYQKQQGDTEHYLIKHFLILIFGLSLLYLTHLIKYTYYSRISQIGLFLSLLVLVITLFYGTTLNDARRSITIPFINLTFQSFDIPGYS